MELAAVVALDMLRVGIGFGVCVLYVAAIFLLLKLRPAHPGYLEDMVSEVSVALARIRRG
jgi:hypothetical protein